MDDYPVSGQDVHIGGYRVPRDRLQALAADIENAGGTALALEADITDRAQAEAAVQQAAGQFGRLDILVNNAGLMLLGPVLGADPGE